MNSIKDIYGLAPVAGEVGVEIEMEGDNLPGGVPGWAIHNDPSMQGPGLEYVFKAPAKRDAVKVRLSDLNQAFKINNSILNPSDRDGVHVHINCQNLTKKGVLCYASLYFIFEEILLRWCGDERSGNLFCLRTMDAEGLLKTLFEQHDCKAFEKIRRDTVRYSSCNFESIPKFGSLEFRALPTTKDFEERIPTWVDVLLSLKDQSLNFAEPFNIVESFSRIGTLQFAKQILGKHFETFYCDGMEKMLIDGIRRVQDIAYANNIYELLKKDVAIKQEKLLKEQEENQKRLAGGKDLGWWERNYLLLPKGKRFPVVKTGEYDHHGRAEVLPPNEDPTPYRLVEGDYALPDGLMDWENFDADAKNLQALKRAWKKKKEAENKVELNAVVEAIDKRNRMILEALNIPPEPAPAPKPKRARAIKINPIPFVPDAQPNPPPNWGWQAAVDQFDPDFEP